MEADCLSSAAESVEELMFLAVESVEELMFLGVMFLDMVGTGETGAVFVYMLANTRLGVSASDVMVGVLDTAGSQGLSPTDMIVEIKKGMKDRNTEFRAEL